MFFLSLLQTSQTLEPLQPSPLTSGFRSWVFIMQHCQRRIIMVAVLSPPPPPPNFEIFFTIGILIFFLLL